MRLQTKLTLAFAIVALAPIGVLLGVARVVVANQFRGEFRRGLDEARASVDGEWQRLRDDVQAATRRIARSDDPLVGPLLLALAKGPLDDDQARDLEPRAENELRALGLDVLTLYDERGEVLAAPQLAGRVGDVDAEAPRLAREAAGQPQLVDEPILDGGRAVKRLAVIAVRTVEAPALGDETHRARVIVRAGKLLGPAFLERLPAGARLLAPDGKLFAGQPRRQDWPTARVTLDRADGTPAAVVEVSRSDEELRRTLALISVAGAGLGSAALALAVLVGAAVARRLTTPIEQLADGARAVARGRLDAQVEVRGNDELTELARAFNGMTVDLVDAREALARSERVAAWREIAQRIAHEIKNPLTPIQMAIETLQRAHARARADAQVPFDALFAESAATILDEVARLKNIVSEFSSFARMPAPQLGPVDVNAVVGQVLALYAGAAPIAPALAPSLPRAQADRDQLTQVLVNLVENARDAVAEKGSGGIRVTTRAAAGRVEIEVADDGPGFAEEARVRLFTPYFTTKPKGTGLGLAIVHRIVSDHGGEIRVGGAPGVGAVFTVALPLASA